MSLDKKIVIFDLDGTLALIDKRRDISTDDKGKMDWSKFFDPDMIDLDDPNTPVIQMTKLLSMDYRIWILSGRSDVTQQATIDYAHQQPYCKPCCHNYRKDVKMFRIRK